MAKWFIAALMLVASTVAAQAGGAAYATSSTTVIPQGANVTGVYIKAGDRGTVQVLNGSASAVARLTFAVRASDSVFIPVPTIRFGSGVYVDMDATIDEVTIFYE